MWPDLPQELVDCILEHLWDDKLSLFNVSLTYHRVRDSPVCDRLLERNEGLWINGRRDLEAVSRVMSSRSGRQFYALSTTQVFISENQRNPFAHAIPLCIPASCLPRVAEVHFQNIDWTMHRPHANVFLLLAHFRSVTSLFLFDCRFQSGYDLRRLTNTLPSLMRLGLWNISCGGLAPRGQLGSRNGSALKSLVLSLTSLYHPCKCLPPYDNALLATCARYTTIDELELHDGYAFRSLDHLLSFITNFPVLTGLTLGAKSRVSEMIRTFSLDDAEAALSPARTCSLSLSSFRLHDIPSKLIQPILDWVALSPSISTLRVLIIHPTEDSEAAGYAIDRFLERVNNGLKEFRLQVFVPGYSPSLAASGLETIHLCMSTSEDTQDLEATLYTITYALSTITSRNLRGVTLILKFETHEFTTFDLDPAVSDFLQANPLASVFSRDVFNEQAPVVHLLIDVSARDRSAVLDAAVGILPALFEPWKARGELYVHLPNYYKNRR